MSFGGGGSYVQKSPGERAQADLAQEQWDLYKTEYAPLDTQRIARARDKDRGRTLGINMAAGGAGQAYSGAENAVVRGLTTRGVNPNSGKFMDAVTDTIAGRGFGVGMAGANAETAADKRYAGNMFNVIAHGRGKQGIAIAGINDTARRESSNARFDASMKSAEHSSMMQGIGSLAGIGLGLGYKHFKGKTTTSSGGQTILPNGGGLRNLGKNYAFPNAQ